MKVLFAGGVPKDLCFPADNEDAFELSNGFVALCDGASESFDSKTWARLLATRFVRNPDVGPDWLNEAVAEYAVLCADKYDLTNLSWSKQAAFERGSFSTLLGVEKLTDGVRVLGIGDSLAVLLDGDEVVDSFPYQRSSQFQQRPELFGTRAALNSSFLSPDFFSLHYQTWSVPAESTSPVVLCMTDALAEWALGNAEEGRPVWQTLQRIREASELEALVLLERQSRTMRFDDSTLLTLALREGHEE